jgi:fatty-acyl-CoA synthase
MSELLSCTIGDLLNIRADERPDSPCLKSYNFEADYTYARFREECDTIARGFMALGMQKGSHLAIWATNYPEWIVTQFASAKAGIVLVTVNTNYKKFELEYLLGQCDAETLILIDGFKDANYTEYLYALCPELETCEPGKLRSRKFPRLKNVITLGEERKPGMFLWSDLHHMAEKVSAEQLHARESECDIHDVVNMQYTSGTTGFPKGVMLTHHNLVNNGNSIADCMAFTFRDRLCIPVPLFHCFGCVLGVMAAISKGASIVLVDYFNPVWVMDAIQKEKCTAVHGVPTMYIAILGHPDFSKYDYSTLRTGIMAGSPCPIEVMKRVVNEMGARDITIAFGLTEASPVICQTRTDDPIEARVSSIGRMLPHMEVKIIDTETGKDCPAGKHGEIVTRGYQVMKGYYKMPEATHQAIDAQGWLHTGDIGCCDEEGYFHITGRLKDMIIRGGENIYPREIEEYLYTHPAVRDVQVVGVPDKKYGEEVLAYIILREGVQATAEEIISYVKNGLSRYKAPRYVLFIDSYPSTASGKIQKYKLRERAVVELGLQDAEAIETA